MLSTTSAAIPRPVIFQFFALVIYVNIQNFFLLFFPFRRYNNNNNNNNNNTNGNNKNVIS